jgi:hypothetical protein
MSDMQDEVRRLLHDKATDMPPHLEAPPSLTKRVRPRIARNAAIVAASLTLLTVGGIAGFRSLNEPVEQSLTSDSPAAPGPSECVAAQLEPTLVLEGAVGSRVGAIRLRNAGGATCTLSGAGHMSLRGADGEQLPAHVTPTEPTWKVDGQPRPDGWPVVTLAPGDSASIRIGWSNWCGTDPAPILLLAAPDRSEMARIATTAIDVPPCNGPEMPSTVEIGPFESGS